MDRRSYLLLLLPLAACSSDLDVPPEPYEVRQVYSPSTGEIPIPNDLLFLGSLDGTLNLPDPTNPAQQPLIDGLNSLDGWSMNAPISFAFDGPVDPSTVVGGSSVRLFEVTLAVNPANGLTLGMPVTGIVRELSSPAEFVVAPADASGASYALLPTSPLAAKTSYMLIVTSDVHDEHDHPVGPGTTYELAQTPIAEIDFPADHPLDALQVLINAMEGAAATATPPVAAGTTVMSLTFTTQSALDVHATAYAVAGGGETFVLAQMASLGFVAAGSAAPANTVPSATVGNAVGNTSAFGPFLGHADLYTGSLTIPYYLTAADNPTGALSSDPAPLTERWEARFGLLEGAPGAPVDTDKHVTSLNPLALQTGEETIPMLISLPNGTSTGGAQPAEGWPVVIFQHGITQNRSNLIAIADAFADAGFAAIAIDLPLHGIPTAADNPALFTSTMSGGLRERTFGLDLSGGGANFDEPDGIADASGAHFVNIASPQTQRDNLRQAVADLAAMLKVINDNMDVDGVGLAGDFDPSRIHFVGHSLGAMVGTVFCAADDGLQGPIRSATLSMPGGGIPKLLAASEAFGPALLARLAAAGVVEGTPEFEQLMFGFQTIIDSGDPISVSSELGASDTPILLHEIVGGGPGGGLPDQVVPNSVPGAPLSGTDPMIAALGLIVVDTTTDGDKLAVRFKEGTHSSLLDPGSTPSEFAAFVELQLQVALWLSSIDTTPSVTITDTSVIEQQP
jgi:pimeloyl-ACP methyl ester carboxylesterase